MEEKKYYYSDDENLEKELIELFGIPDENYDKAFIMCCALPDNYDAFTTEELYEFVRPLEDEGYFVGNRKTREFLIEYIEHIKDKGKDRGLTQEDAIETSKQQGWMADYSGNGTENRQNTPYGRLK